MSDTTPNLGLHIRGPIASENAPGGSAASAWDFDVNMELLDAWSATIGGGGKWGSITGTLSDQLDLQAALNALVPSVFGRTGAIVAVADDYAAVDNVTVGDSIGNGLEVFTATGTAALQGNSRGIVAGGPAVLTMGVGNNPAFSITSGASFNASQISTDSTGTAISVSGLKFDASAVGEVDVPTVTSSDNTTKAASTAFVKAQGYAVAASLATVATSGAYADLSGKPVLPSNTTATTHQFFTAYNST